MRLANLALGIVSAASLLAIASPARADAAAGASRAASCEARLGGMIQAGPQPGIKLPSNAPALLVIDPQPNDYSMPATVTAELLNGDTKVPFQAPSRDANGINRLTLPTNAVGTHRISVQATCNGGYTTGPTELSLELGGAVPFPTSVGTLTATPVAGPPTGVTTFDLEPATNVREFLPVIQFWTTIDGEKAVATGGAVSAAKLSFTVKTGAVCVENGALHREKRNVKLGVAAAIAGVDKPLQEATVDITVDCGAIKWTRESDFENEPTDGTTPTTTPGAQGSSTASGCSAAPLSVNAATSATGGSFAALGLAALVVARRRRRQA